METPSGTIDAIFGLAWDRRPRPIDPRPSHPEPEDSRPKTEESAPRLRKAPPLLGKGHARSSSARGAEWSLTGRTQGVWV